MDRETLAALLDAVSDGVVVCDERGRFTHVNQFARERFGSGTVDCAPEGWSLVYGLYLPDGVTPFPTEELPLVRAMKGEACEGVELCLRMAGHTMTWVSVNARPVADEDGTQRGAVAVIRDLGSRKRDADQLKRVNGLLDSIVENVPLMIFVKEARELRFELFNRAGEELLGQPRQNLIGKSDFDLFPREQAAGFQARDRQALETGLAVEVAEERIQTQAGERWLQTKKIPIRDASGEARYLLGISHDITVRKEAEAELTRAHLELETRVAERTAELSRMNLELTQEVAERKRAELLLQKSEDQLRQSQKMEAVGRLAGGIAHDFNNALMVITTAASLQLDRLGSAESIRNDLEQIFKAADHAAGLTRQLLAFSRQQVLQPRIIDLNQVVAELKPMLQRLVGPELELKTALDPFLGPTLADAGQMEQVLINLAVNARDATPGAGGLSIRTGELELTSRDPRGLPVPAGRWITLSVTDTGSGMDAPTRARIFEPFFTTKAPGKGTGLGLATVYGIIKQSGGEIAVESAPGRGTRFDIYLPRIEPTDAPLFTPVREKPEGGPETILLAEDDPGVRAAARRILASGGYRVVTTSDGREALELARTHPSALDLLLTDVSMPNLNGPELAIAISELLPGIKVIFMSGYAGDSVRAEPGTPKHGFLQKPFTPASLLRCVRDALDSSTFAPAKR